MNLCVIILTFNESIHIERCLKNILELTNSIFVVDSFSNDKTIEIIKKYNIKYAQRKFINQSEQLNWATNNLPYEAEWILRIDADEYLDIELIKSISDFFNNNHDHYTHAFLNRKIIFLNRKINFGGFNSLSILRLWKIGFAYVENSWMDEHVVPLRGNGIKLKGTIIDENLNSIGWWITKHNNYATRMAIEHFICNHSINQAPVKMQNIKGNLSNTRIKRLIRIHIYDRLPIAIRSTLYFIFRYFILLGVLDGKIGFLFHFLQAFWYRTLVDAKIYEITSYSKSNNATILKSIEEIYGINVLGENSFSIKDKLSK